MGWADYGMPITRNEDVDKCLALLRTWYVDYRQLNGGFLHVWAEDGNLSDDQVLRPNAFDIAYDGLDAGVARDHAAGYLPREVTAEMLKQHMGEIIECWRNMDEPERFSAWAWHHGDAQAYLAKLQPWDSWGDVERPCEGNPSVTPVLTWHPPVVEGPLKLGPGFPLSGTEASDQDLANAAVRVRALSGAPMGPDVADRIATLLETLNRVPQPPHVDVIQAVVDARYLARALNHTDPNHWTTWASSSDRPGLVEQIQTWQAANDFARSPEWHQAIDAVLDIIREHGGDAR